MNAINSRTVIIGVAALVVGVAIGVTAKDLESATNGGTGTPNHDTNQMSVSTLPKAGMTARTWDPFQEIRSMQLQMDKLFNQMSADFYHEPQFSGIVQNPAYSLSLDVQDMKDRFVVRAFLPDTNVSDVNVQLDNQTLKVDVSNQQTQKSDKNNATMSVAQWGQYEQVIQLPAPVKADQMQIERKDHELMITLPKK